MALMKRYCDLLSLNMRARKSKKHGKRLLREQRSQKKPRTLKKDEDRAERTPKKENVQNEEQSSQAGL